MYYLEERGQCDGLSQLAGFMMYGLIPVKNCRPASADFC